ncbi:UUP1 family membrane protein [Sulfuriroseicoccus oceanibius]|uniref:Inactive transglutaminase family protein n=1 Tax=Sulfuriroseicoccus oceanibius TaxID=2707525 RepID=A0A6B3LE22_9BACT|nr:UUP1 family membrane protein [Sulfuriroseicoccus oceanibius]QQL45968.1 inactive transglutaminase family protein [Sulfuriroseicoccus oceanibius]
MKSAIQLRILIATLAVIGLASTLYRHFQTGYPLTPDQKLPVWTIEAKLTFTAEPDTPVRVRFAVPDEQPRLGILEESGASPNFGFTPPPTAEDASSFFRYVTWSKQQAEGKQELFYRIDIYQRPETPIPLLPSPPVELPADLQEGPQAVAADEIIALARQYSADTESFVSQLLTILKDSNNQNVQALLANRKKPLEENQLLHQLLAKAGLDAHFIRYIPLEKSASNISLQHAVAVIDNGKMQLFAFGSPHPLDTSKALIWQRGGPALVELSGGRNGRISFSTIEQFLPAELVQETAARRKQETLTDLSLSSLSIEQQNAYRLLLMIPFGALVVVIMRNIVGIKTSGTFMPILLAMSFLKTDLLPGLLLFTIVVSVGLIVRSYLSKLDLLLVPRISAVVVVVIGIMVGFGIIGSKFNLVIAQSVTLFPTIILAWTVERLSILWEEDGAGEVAKQTSGSLLVAVLAYLVMGNPTLRYQVFIFPELLLVVLAVILALGQYAGYRLSELVRFAPLVKSQDNAPR